MDEITEREKVVAREVKLEYVMVEWKIYSTAANLDVLKIV